MKTGYEDYFKKARKSAAAGNKPPPRVSASSVSPSAAPLHRKGDARNLKVSQVEELRKRIKDSKKTKRKALPKSLMVMTILGFTVTGFGLMNHEELDKWISRVEVAAIPTAQASEDRKPAAIDAKATAETAKPAPEKSTADLSADEINHLKKLVERKDELDSREEELRRLEAELTAQKTEIEKKMKSLEETRAGITGVLSERSTQDQAKVDSLVQMYSTMKPAQAAKVLEAMDEDLAVEIIGKMKKKNAAEVLNLMKAEKAQAFSEKFAGYRKR